MPRIGEALTAKCTQRSAWRRPPFRMRISAHIPVIRQRCAALIGRPSLIPSETSGLIPSAYLQRHPRLKHGSS